MITNPDFNAPLFPLFPEWDLWEDIREPVAELKSHFSHNLSPDNDNPSKVCHFAFIHFFFYRNFTFLGSILPVIVTCSTTSLSRTCYPPPCPNGDGQNCWGSNFKISMTFINLLWPHSSRHLLKMFLRA